MLLSSIPDILCIFVTSNDSSNVKSGNIVGILFAIIVFPEPGGPINMQLCPPAAAISNSLFTFSCPFTSEKSSFYLLFLLYIFNMSICAFSIFLFPFR